MSTRRRATQTRSLIGIKERYTRIQAAAAMQLQLIDSPTSSTWAKSINAPQSTRASQPANQSSPISHYHNERDKGDRSRGAVGRRVVRVADKPMASAGGGRGGEAAGANRASGGWPEGSSSILGARSIGAGKATPTAPAAARSSDGNGEHRWSAARRCREEAVSPGRARQIPAAVVPSRRETTSGGS